MINQKGETILEITIALGLILIVVSGIAIATVNGLRNSQFAKNQLTATKYAQEMLEGVRSIKDRDYSVCGPAPVLRWSDVWAFSFTSANYNFILRTTGTTCNTTSDPFWLQNQAAAEVITNSGTTFSRQIRVENTAQTNQKKVTAIVKWDDASGSHQSELTTILSDYR